MKKIIAVLIAIAMLAALTACGSKTNTEDLSTSAEETAGEITGEAETESTTEEAETEEPSEAESETGTQTPAETKADESETAAESTTAEEKTTAAAPATTADIIALYNKSVNNAYDKKAGFLKERYTDNANYDMSVALRAFKSLVEKFIGIGDENKYTETVSKGNWDSDAKRHYLRKSTLSAGDVTGATCTEDGGIYTVTLNVKGGNSTGSSDAKSTNAPVDKCGICVGNEDKGYYDHKTAEVIYDAIAGTYSGAKIKESYNNAKVVAKIDAATGELKGLTVTFDIAVDIDIGIGSGTATGTTHIIYKDFKY